jgi:pyruvate/oxaloacetate carboxyltransferase
MARGMVRDLQTELLDRSQNLVRYRTVANEIMPKSVSIFLSMFEYGMEIFKNILVPNQNANVFVMRPFGRRDYLSEEG